MKSQLQIPFSEKLNTASLARLFDNKSESYKLFWFKAILYEVGQGRANISFRELIERMIVDALLTHLRRLCFTLRKKKSSYQL